MNLGEENHFHLKENTPYLYIKTIGECFLGIKNRSEDRMKYINTSCGRNSHFLNGKADGRCINNDALQGKIPALKHRLSEW
jgi:hypothetical protein